MKKINYFGKEYTVSDDIKWVATNSYGSVLGFTYEPIQTDIGWAGGVPHRMGVNRGAANWENSLRKVEGILVKENKLKCVSNIGSMGEVSDYLTVGKIYDAKKLPTGLYEVIDDDGDVLSTLLSGSVHAKWEIVSDTKPHPHADLMLKYAQIAQYDDKPWECFEYETSTGWVTCLPMVAFNENVNYRLKPQEPKVQVGQTWVSKEGIDVELVTSVVTGCVTTRLTLGGNKIHWSFLCSDFLQNFKRKE